MFVSGSTHDYLSQLFSENIMIYDRGVKADHLLLAFTGLVWDSREASLSNAC
jgi:hypothetical protein